MDSPLSYINSEGFRKEIMVKNLKPYAKSPKQPDFPITYEYKQSSLSVTDSPDNILDQALPESIKWKGINKYGNGSQEVLDSAPFFESIDRPTDGTAPRGFNNQPYPSTFLPSSYSPLSILLNVDPQGSDGLLSQDSFIVRLGAQKLREEFENRIARQIEKQTIGRANFLNVDGVSDIINIINGKVPLIEPNYTITVPENPILAANDFILRLGGSILPVSTIPGSYWDTNTSLRQPSTIGQLQNAFRNSFLGNFVSNLLGTNQTGSQIFYNNTGAGQKSRLFYNIDFNRYKPSYDRTLFNRLVGSLVESTTNNSDFYIGSNTSDPSRILSPSRELPINSYGQELQVPVYGPSEIAKQFDGASQSIKIGANGPNYSDGGGIEGGFTWVSPKYKGNAGKKVGLGGEIANEDEDFSPSSYSSTESTNNQFRDGSILDQTQRIIDSQPNGARRLQHVGNAIDQVSKVFNDGYKEITKGSKVLSYVGSIGQEVGTEYCRIFTKDTPYLQYNDLQKTDGMTTEGRKFAYSVLDKTYNLNIVPNKLEGGKSSTNIITGEGNNLGYAKKYMFSLENLAWRTSSTPGYTVADLPMCERGPNGGRVMWFPPYNLTFDENSQANWKNTDFIGRPEPVFTYTNTSRTGSLSWDIVVDHPSVLNIIVNKVLADQTNKVRINGIIDSFFAGCRKYDLYELAKKYYKINRNDLYELQKLITDKKVTNEQINYIKQTLQTGNDSPTNNDTPVAPTQDTTDWSKYPGFAFYFENDKPAKGLVPNYQLEYNLYINNKSIYEKESDNATQTNEFFERVVTPNFSVMNKLITDLEQKLKQFPQGNITINLEATCSAPASIAYNDVLADRRMVSVVKYFEGNSSLQKFINDKRLILMTGSTPGEATVSSGVATSTVSTPKAYNGNGNNNDVANFEDKGRVLCSDQGTGVQGGDTTVVARGVYNVRAMSCRRVSITKITSTLKENTPEPQPIKPNTVDVLVENKIITSKTVPVSEEVEVLRDNITKRVLRSLLSECDYFEVIKETTPMVYDNLRDKLKFFQPAFHSMTPEGLNSRLTFLQQCVRPGDTIPTVVERDGEVTRQYNNATNTAFGAPPVLILRIGDFFNTKIIPRTLNLKYENLDLNPEGIGVQPMIAKVTLSFDFIGGSGLKNSVDRLQNALSFNYYANTEMWDDRADVTDDSYKILDKEFLEAILTPQPPSPNQGTQSAGQDNNNTIGTILTKVFGDFQTGTTTYSDFMVNAKDQTQQYFTTVVNKVKESNEQYNNAVRQQWVLERNYTVGNFDINPTEKVRIFGKPRNIQKRFDEISQKFITNIEDESDLFIQFLKLPDRNFNIKVIRQIKQNYSKFVLNKVQVFQNAIFKIVQDVVNQEQSYIHTLGQINTITFNQDINRGTDGFQEKKGNVVIFNLSGTTGVNQSSENVTNTLQELIEDTKKIKNDLVIFNTEIGKSHDFTFTGNKKSYSGILVNEVSDDGIQKGNSLTIEQVFVPFTDKSKNIASTLKLSFNDYSFRRTYMFVSDEIMDEKKYQTFKDQLLAGILDNSALLGKQNRTNISEVFDFYWKECANPIFMEENNITKEFVDSMEKNVLKDFLNYKPFDKKERVFTYTTQSVGDPTNLETQTSLIKGLGLTQNNNKNLNTWNDNLISKVKLN